ncbi:MAG: SDR family NAD(P)-dependent oxidoreductase [Myxococcota bacterium]
MHHSAFDRSVAVVGIGCRFPGGITSPREFWQFLLRGGDAIQEVPRDRWDADALFAADPHAAGRTYARRGGFLDKIRQFDPDFFGISPREAEQIDPQQRLLLETAHEAMEDAGERWDDPAVRQTGVFVGVFIHDYQHMQFAERDRLGAHSGTGTAMSITANRISYAFDLKGPSVAVDTACSSSLVAVDLACKALLNGDCDYALAGGVNVILKPEMTIAMSKATMLSRDGRCKSFDSRADGYVRGEGAAMLLLRRAVNIRRTHRTYALIRASGVNSDGKTPGISVPNGEAQEALTRRVLADANVSPATVGYVEAHGTGTPVGDPIEATALGRVFREGRSSDSPALRLGSVKTNLGHLESASGVAGLIKAALCVKLGEIPGNLHFEKGNAAIDFEGLRLQVVSQNEPWPSAEQPRRAAVNSFGFGGTNAHVLLEQAPEPEQSETASAGEPWPSLVLPLGAHHEAALRALAGHYADALQGGVALRDLLYTASQRRSHGARRAALGATDAGELSTKLRAFANGETPLGCRLGVRAEGFSGRPVFVFSGMGPQWWGMARDLIQQQPVFSAELRRVDAALARHSGWSVLDELLRDEVSSRIQETQVAQPAIFAVQAGLLALWAHWGVQASAVVGHSVGEICALYAAGVLSLEDAACVAVQRSRLQARTAGSGGMLAAGFEVTEARSLLEEFAGLVSIAAINSPTALTLSGELSALQQIQERLEAQGRFARMLRVEVPYHSAKMDPLRNDLLQALAGLQPAAPSCRYYSTTDAPSTFGRLGDADYWWRNVRQTVLFAAAMNAALEDGEQCFLEIGPHPVLQGAIVECMAARGVAGKAIGSLRRGVSDFEALSTSISELHVVGAELAWDRIVGSGRLAELPPYPWQRAEYWSESEQAERYRKGADAGPTRVGAGKRHALLGAKLDLPSPTWLQTLRPHEHAYVSDHRVQGSVVFPGAGYLEMALQTLVQAEGNELDEAHSLVLRNVEITRALHIREGEQVELQTERDGERWSVHSCISSDGSWVQHAVGRCRREKLTEAPTPLALESIMERCTKSLPSEYAYSLFADVGLQYGAAFRGIRELWYGNQECLARVEAPEALRQSPTAENTFLFHPALLDACLHTLFGALNLNGEDADRRGNVFLPVSVEQLRLYRRAPSELWSHARLKAKAGQHFTADISVYDTTGDVVCEVVGLRCQALESAAAVSEQRKRNWGLEYEWQDLPVGAANQPRLQGRWLVLAEHDHPLIHEMQAQGAQCVVIAPRAADDVAAAISSAIVASKFDGVVHAWCLQKEPETEAGASWPHQELGALSLLSLVQVLAQHIEQSPHASAPPLWILTTLTQAVPPTSPVRVSHSTVWGLRRVIANEHPALQARCVDLDCSRESLQALLAGLASAPADDELAFRKGVRFVHRLRRQRLEAPLPPLSSNAERMELRVEKPGDLRSIAWVTLPEFELEPHEVEIEVQATGLNFKDVMKATGLFPPRLVEGNLWSRDTLGMECAGQIVRLGSAVNDFHVGQKVMALAPRTFASHTITHRELVVPNANLTSQAAATVPVAFLTACVGLEQQAKLQAGERVLIHAASGGVGLAALQIAKAIGAEVFATAGSEEKRELLRKLGVQHVFDSRSLHFADEIRKVTNGEGVDVVLNSLAGDAITESVNLLRDYGRFVEIGKMDLDRDFPLGLRPFTRCLSFHAVDLDRMLAQRVHLCGQILRSIHERIAAGVLRPLPARCFATNEAPEAFQTMASARHTGKVVIDIAPGTVPVQQSRALRFRRDASYLVTGGLSGFGLQLALWLAERGAGNLVLLGRRGMETPGALQAVAKLRRFGAEVQVEACDIADAEQTRKALEHVSADRPLRGVFHAAAVLDDALLKNLQKERFRTTFAAKAIGAWNLHRATCDASLDYFMCFSSMASVLGNQGSGNYCAANAFVDALAHHRRSLGLTALTVNWGVIADVGMAADEDFYRQNLERNGLKTIHSRHCLEMLELLLQSDRTQTTVCPIDFDTWLKFNPAGRDGRLSELIQERQQARTTIRVQSTEEVLLRAKLAELDETARRELALSTVTQILAHVLRTPAANIEPTRSLTALGADSLMAIEIKNRLETVGLAISVTQLLNRNSATTLAKLLLDSLGHVDGSSQEAVRTESSTWLVCNAPRPEARMRLICFPYAGGGPSVYHHWPQAFPDSIEIRTICLPGRGPRTGEANIASIAEAADAIVPELLPLLDRPFALFGHCMGAILMYEVAQRLEAQHGKAAVQLFASGCMAPHLYNSPVVHEQENQAFLDVLRLISFSGTRALIEDEDLRKSMFPLLRGDFRAVAEYGSNFSIRAALSAPITGLAAENDLFAAPKAMLAWGRYTTSGYELLKLPGDHYFVESDRDVVTRIVLSRLDAASLDASKSGSIPAPIRPDAAVLEPLTASPLPGNLRATQSSAGQLLVFCFPGAGIPVEEFELPRDGERLYRAIEWRSTQGGPAARTVAEGVEHAFAMLKSHLDTAFAFYGHCLGAIVAYELALRLQREGLPTPEHLITAGAVGPHLYVAPDAHRLPDAKLLELLRVLKHPVSGRLDVDSEFRTERLPLIRSDFEAMAAYHYSGGQLLDTPVSAISLRHDLWSYPLRTDSWRQHTAQRCEIVEHAGDHYLTLRQPELVDELLRASASRSVAAE